MNAVLEPARTGEAAQPLLRLSRIHKRYSNGTVALRDMSLDCSARRLRQPARPLRAAARARPCG